MSWALFKSNKKKGPNHANCVMCIVVLALTYFSKISITFWSELKIE